MNRRHSFSRTSQRMTDRIPRAALISIALVLIVGVAFFASTRGGIVDNRADYTIRQYQDRASQLESKVASLQTENDNKRAQIERLNNDVIKSLMEKAEADKKVASQNKEREKTRQVEIEQQCKTETAVQKSQIMAEIAKVKTELRDAVALLPTVREERTAFITLVTNNFWKPGIVLVQSARDHGVTAPFVIMAVDPDGVLPTDPKFVKLPAEAEAAFKKLNAEVRYIDPVPIPEGAQFENPRWSIAWNKLRAWTFEEFTRLVFLDSDMMVRADITEMLSFPEFSTAPGQDEPCETHHGINGGVLVFAPNKTVYNQLIEFSTSFPSHWRAAEQELLGHFYLTLYRHRFHLISGLYNISLRTCKCLKPIVFTDHVKIIHFYSGPKPWDHTAQIWADPNLPDLEAPCIAEIILQWYNTLERGLTQ
eukprot:TRINITY_DN460_c0_g2_i3.p1 TRINITY_DN460_c0_g2~~TRINITY_DN460_c0_g2_i3.p1  ORF type:complete len:454 (-),score=113.91 TRINITY_DN460_c0_g2_i3:72-1337(-)